MGIEPATKQHSFLPPSFAQHLGVGEEFVGARVFFKNYDSPSEKSIKCEVKLFKRQFMHSLLIKLMRKIL